VRQVRNPKKFVFSRGTPDLRDEMAPSPDTAALFEPHDISIADRLIEGARIENRAAGTLRIESSILEAVSLAGSNFASIVWKDVRLVRCDLANLETRYLTLTRVELIDCRMTGLRAGEADCQDILVSAGDQRHCQFRFSTVLAQSGGPLQLMKIAAIQG
jgi:hypothetical protein